MYRRASAVAVVAAAIVALAVVLRFYHIGARRVHFAEGIHAYYAWRFATDGEFVYEPWRHGPLLYSLTAPPMRLIDDSVVGRTVVAAVSLAMFPALYLLRRDLPRSALLFAAAVLAVHPYALRNGEVRPERCPPRDVLPAGDRPVRGVPAVALPSAVRRPRGDRGTGVRHQGGGVPARVGHRAPDRRGGALRRAVLRARRRRDDFFIYAPQEGRSDA